MSTKSKAQIVATIGPSSKSKEIISQMVMHQIGLVRLNFSWGTHEDHLQYIHDVRDAAREAGRQIPIIQDLSGPREQKADGHEFNQSATEVITEKDLYDVKFGIENGVEYVAMSFVGTDDDVRKIKSEIQKIVEASNGTFKEPLVIAKIERKIAIENFDSILEASDAIMIARGDLGNEVPLEQIPFIEKMIIEKCKKAGKSVITATQMMLTMKDNPFPTRAEVTDVAFAVITGSDAVMLSEESASGKYPVEAVEMMERIIVESQKHLGDVLINPL